MDYVKDKDLIFEFNPTLKKSGLILIICAVLFFLLFAFSAIMELASSNDPVTAIGLATMAVVFALLFGGIGIYLYARARGQIILTGDSIILKKGKKEKSVLYSEIKEIKIDTYHIPQGFRIVTENDSLCFSKAVIGYGELWESLVDRAGTKIMEPISKNFPVSLSLPSSFRIMAFSIIGSGVMLPFVLFIILRALNNYSAGRISFITGGFSILIAAAFAIEKFSNKMPVAMDLTDNKIEFKYMGNNKLEFDLKDISRIVFTQEARNVNLDYRRSRRVIALVPVIQFWFKDETVFSLTEDCFKRWKCSIEKMFVTLKYLYPDIIYKEEKVSM